MPARSTSLRYVYLLLAIPGALWPGYYFLDGVSGEAMLHDMFASPSVSLIVADLLLASLVGVAFMTIEARRLGMRWPAYLAVAIFVPFAIVLPVFLYRREIALDRLDTARPT